MPRVQAARLPENTPDTFAEQGTRELGRFSAMGQFLPPDRRTRLAQRRLGVFETAADTHYKYSGSSTNWSSRGSAGSRADSPGFGGALAVANVRSGPSHKPQCRRIFSTTSRWRRSMKAMTFIFDPIDRNFNSLGGASQVCSRRFWRFRAGLRGVFVELADFPSRFRTPDLVDNPYVLCT